jgi:hypothetical protein
MYYSLLIVNMYIVFILHVQYLAHHIRVYNIHKAQYIRSFRILSSPSYNGSLVT